MIEGIEILAQTEIMQSPVWIEAAINIIMPIMFISVIMGVSGLAGEIPFFTFAGSIIFVVGLISIIVLSFFNIEEHTGRYEYQVIIGENVSFTDVYSNYEVV